MTESSSDNNDVDMSTTNNSNNTNNKTKTPTDVWPSFNPQQPKPIQPFTGTSPLRKKRKKNTISSSKSTKQENESSSSSDNDVITIMDSVLVDGYVRNIEKLLDAHIIPIEIVQLCSAYYCMLVRLLHISAANNQNKRFQRKIKSELHISDINNQHPMKSVSWKSNIISLETKKQTKLFLNPQSGGLCRTSYLQLPTKIKQQIFNVTNIKNNRKYEAVFSLGTFQMRTYSDAIIFDKKQFETTPEQCAITAFHWKLPELLAPINVDTCAFSKKYGLIALGMEDTNFARTKKFYRLEFDSNEYRQSYKWTWNVLNSVPTHSIDGYSSLILENKFVIIGEKNISLYNLDENKWNENLAKLKYSRIKCGVLWDEMSSIIYAGGGETKVNRDRYMRNHYSMREDNDLSCHIEYYNIYQDKWFDDLPEPWMAHKMYPILWKDHSILYIASAWNDGAEYLDLRENAKMWTRVYINNMQSLSNVFGKPTQRLI